MGPIPSGAVARRQPPAALAVALVPARVLDDVGAVDSRDVTVVLEVARVPVPHGTRVEAQIRVVGEEERPAAPDADVERDPVVRRPVGVAIPLPSASPPLSVLGRLVRLAGPPAVVQLGRHGVRRRRDGQHVGDERLVEADQLVVDVPGIVGRPVPVEIAAVRALPIPVPLDAPPQRRDRADDPPLDVVVTREVLARREQALHQEGSLDEVPAVVVLAEDGNDLARGAVEEVRPGAVEPVGALEELDDAEQAARALVASDEAAFDADDQRHDSEPRRAGGDDAGIARDVLERHTRHGVRSFPVVAEAGLLHHRQQPLVVELPGGRLRDGRERRLAVRAVARRHLVESPPARLAEEVRVARDTRLLHTDRLVAHAVERPVDHVPLRLAPGARRPAEVDVALVGHGLQRSRRGRRGRRCTTAVHLDLVHEQGVRRAVGRALQHGEGRDAVRVEAAGGRRGEGRQRELDLRPPPGRDVGRHAGEIDSCRARPTGVSQAKVREVNGPQRLARVAPEGEGVSEEHRLAVAPLVHVDRRLPGAARGGRPLEAERVRRRARDRGIHREAPAVEHQPARRDEPAGAVIVPLRR